MWPFTKRESKKFADTQATIQGLPAVRWNISSSKAYATDGYQRCVIVARCVEIISQSIATIPVKVEVNGAEVEKHPLLTLLKKPNPVQSGTSLLEAYLSFYLITGNGFIEALRASSGEPKELYVWPSFPMKSVEPRAGFVPLGYVYDDGVPAHARTWDVDPLTGYSDLLQIKTFNPMDPFYGLSPVATAAFAVDQHNEANTWNMRLLQNASVPQGALCIKQQLTEGQYAKFKAELEESYTGAKNARRPMILSGDMAWQTMALSPLEMDWLNGKKMSSQDIAAAFGVPTQVIPIPGEQTFANYEQARLALWQDTVVPLAEKVYEELSRWFSQMYGEKIEIKLKLDKVPALEPSRVAKWTVIQAATFLTLNEKREALDMEPMKDVRGADQLYMPNTAVALQSTKDIESSMTDVQKTSMNGLQITSMLDIITQVAQGTLPKESATAVMLAAFPALNEAQIKAILEPIEEGSQEVPPEPVPFGGKEAPPDDEALKDQVKKQMKIIGVL
jgi:HK97 family phage portal protein